MLFRSEYLRRAFSIRPEPDIAAHLGEVLWASGQRDEALKLFQQGLREFPGNKPLTDTARRLGVNL